MNAQEAESLVSAAPTFRALLRRSFLRLVIAICLVTTCAVSLGAALMLSLVESPAQNKRMLGSVSDYDWTLRRMLVDADPEFVKRVLAIIRESVSQQILRHDGDADSSVFSGYAISLQAVQHMPPGLVQWIEGGVRHESGDLRPIGPVPPHWQRALRDARNSVIFSEPAGSPILQGDLMEAGAETLLIPITDDRAIAVISPTRVFGHWYGLGSFGWTIAFTGFVAVLALLLPALLVGGSIARADAPRLEKPLTELADVARRFRKGDFAARVRPSGASLETELLGQTFNELGERLQRMIEELRESNADLASSLATQKRLFADISHDLRTPLSAILINAELATRSDPVRTELQVINSEAANLCRLVDDIFAVARLASGQLPLNLSAVDAGEQVAEVVASARADAWRRGVLVRAASDSQVGVRVSADAQRLGQVLRNLVSNAVRHTQEGGLVEITVVRQGERVRISVSDTGEGIDEADLPHVFERFWRADAARSGADGERSSGLGLAIVKDLVEAMSGEVHLDSVRGEGTSVHVVMHVA